MEKIDILRKKLSSIISDNEDVSQNINIENINLIITYQDSIMNKIFSTAGIQYFAPYPSNYKTLPNSNTNRMKMLDTGDHVALNNYLEAYEFLTNYPKQTMRKHFVDFVNQYTSQSTKKAVLTAYFAVLPNNDKFSVMLSFTSHLNKCRITKYSKVYSGHVSCKNYNDNNDAYYDVCYDAVCDNHGAPFKNEHDYILSKNDGNLVFINETMYT